MTTTAPAADRLAQLRQQATDLETRRAALLDDLAALDAAAAERDREAHDALPEVQSGRQDLANELGQADTARKAALHAGTDTTDLAHRCAVLLAELAIVDEDLGQLRGWAASVEAQITHERQLAQHQELLAQVADAETEVRQWIDGSDDKLTAAIDQVRHAVNDLISVVATVQPAYARAGSLRRLAQQQAATLGAPGPAGVVIADPVESAVTRIPGSALGRRRLLLAAARSDRAGVLAGMADVLRSG